jgi:predicted membrane metal-binding protein
VLAAAPAWFANNVSQIAIGTLLVLTVLVVRMIQKAMLRAVLLGLIALVALFVYVNRAPLKACAKTCECEIGGRHITVPTCDSRLEL